MVQLRPPLPMEAPLLTALCLRAKILRGYDAVFMEACCEGPAEILCQGEEAALDKLFVEPQAHDRGFGRPMPRFSISLSEESAP